MKTTLGTSGKDVKTTLRTSGEDVKTTLETSGEDAFLGGHQNVPSVDVFQVYIGVLN